MSADKLFDGSDAQLLPRGSSECATYLRKYNEWRRGNALAAGEMPHPRELGINIDFAIEVLDAMAGHDHLMVIAATRYCLGRMTYVVGDCTAWLIKLWPLLSDNTRNVLQRDIEEHFTRDDADREAGREHKALGWDCDRKEWEKDRRMWTSDQFPDVTKMIDGGAA